MRYLSLFRILPALLLALLLTPRERLRRAGERAPEDGLARRVRSLSRLVCP